MSDERCPSCGEDRLIDIALRFCRVCAKVWPLVADAGTRRSTLPAGVEQRRAATDINKTIMDDDG